MSIRTEPICANCKWYYNFYDLAPDQYGECRERSPRLGEDGEGVWPTVKRLDWCKWFMPTVTDRQEQPDAQ